MYREEQETNSQGLCRVTCSPQGLRTRCRASEKQLLGCGLWALGQVLHRALPGDLCQGLCNGFHSIVFSTYITGIKPQGAHLAFMNALYITFQTSSLYRH